jgi:hypothetical protein
MAVLTTGNTFANGDQVTATNLNAAVNNSIFASGAVDTITTYLNSGAISVKDAGITAAKLETGTNGQLFIGNGTGFTKATLTAGAGVAITNASAAITVSAASLGASPAQYYLTMVDKTDTTGKTLMVSTAYQNAGAGNGDTVFPSNKAVFSGFFTAGSSMNAPEYQSGSTKVVGARGAAVPDVTSTTSISGSDMVNEAVVLASIQALETKLNLLLSRLRSTTGHGLIT